MQRLLLRQPLVERDQLEPQRDVGVGDEQQAGGGLAVAAGAADLLVVRLDRLRQREVRDEPDVRAVDAHTERVGGGDDIERARLEALLHRRAFVAGHAGVVVLGAPSERAQRLRDQLGVPARSGVDDRGAAAGAGLAEPLLHLGRDALVLRLGPAHFLDGEPQVAARESAQHLAGVRHVQPLDDLAAHGGCGRRRAGDEPLRLQPLDEIAELEVVGPEVVAPVADAVRLIDGEQRDRQARQHLIDEPIGGEALRRDVQQLHAAGECHLFAPAILIGRQVRRQVRGRDAARGQRLHLVRHERDERGDHERNAIEVDGGLLKTHALAAAGRRDDEHLAAAAHQLVDRLALPVVEPHHSPFAGTGVHFRLPSGVSVM